MDLTKPAESQQPDWRRMPLPSRRRAKLPVYLRIDAHVLDWFRSRGKGYQGYINAVLDAYVAAQTDTVSASTAHEGDLLRRAQKIFKEYYAQCFWHFDPDHRVSRDNLDLLIEGLRLNGGRAGYILADELCQLKNSSL